MTGDDKCRFCAGCQLHVHNLSAMSHQEQQALLSKRSGRQCVAYVMTDDSIQVRSSTWLLLQRWFYYGRTGIAFATMVLTLGLSSCATKAPKPEPPKILETEASKQDPTRIGGKIIAGGIMPQLPLWRRLLFFWDN